MTGWWWRRLAAEGLQGGSVFGNVDGLLPDIDGAGDPITYSEWDVNPSVKGVDRGPERLVTGSRLSHAKHWCRPGTAGT